MKLSVALCTFNGARYLPEQLRSLVTQSRLPDELIACDDGSTDGTPDVLREFAERAAFPVRVHLNEQTLGTAKNFEKAFGLCSGDVIFPCDQDDSWLPEKLAVMATSFEAEPNVGLVLSDMWLATADLVRTDQRAWQELPFTPAMQRRFAAWRGPAILLRYNVATGAALAFRADLRKIILPIPTDWVPDAWVAFLAAASADVRVIPEPLIVYRRHAGQQVGISRRTIRRQLRAAFTRIDRDYFENAAIRFEQLAERLSHFPPRGSAIAERVRERAAFAADQAQMRGMNRFRRAAVAARHLAAGRYHRFGHGFRSFAVDLIMV